MKEILIKKAIEILEDLKLFVHKYTNSEERLKNIKEEIEVLKTGDEGKVKEFFQSHLYGFEEDLEDGWDCFDSQGEHFDHTALEILARLYLDKTIAYTKCYQNS